MWKALPSLLQYIEARFTIWCWRRECHGKGFVFHLSYCTCIPEIKFFDNLIGWTLATQHWNRNRVSSTITPTLMTLRWHEHHIVNQTWVSLFCHMLMYMCTLCNTYTYVSCVRVNKRDDRSLLLLIIWRYSEDFHIYFSSAEQSKRLKRWQWTTCTCTCVPYTYT